ncbi:DUF551 domain-containing protein [Escherichia coli]|nr:DUF551 domain-containing protein [Escherichia coli]EHY6016199.1 DUF551 domain-containing protein [Escherichia coli]EJU9834815.1 DUF551 domain-containing protein [Escherichia coli]EJW6157211.1 DUF551 domain-containing protein [Escherichia coli]EJW6171437.1 DUF551 domain-containing protein [Escherichia coli]
MSTITKERIELFIKSPLDNGLTRGEQMELARIALASLEAEPVAWKVTFTQIDREYNTFTGMYSDKAEVERWVRLHKACNFRADITPLYTAKPVPVTPDGWISCSEQMPSAGEQVLAYRPDAPESNDPLIKMATYVGGSAHGHGFDCYCKPTHWMPLPAAPQEVNRG